MASLDSILIALMVHVLFCYNFYNAPQSKLNTPGPKIPTVIVFVAILDIINENRIIPNSFENIHANLKYLLEAVTAVFLLEVGMIFWLSVEYSVFLLTKNTLLGLEIIEKRTYAQHETQIIGAVTYPVSVTILAIASQHTDLHNRVISFMHD